MGIGTIEEALLELIYVTKIKTIKEASKVVKYDIRSMHHVPFELRTYEVGLASVGHLPIYGYLAQYVELYTPFSIELLQNRYLQLLINML